MIKKIFLYLALFCLSFLSGAQLQLTLDSLYSESIHAQKKFYILLPETIKDPLPVLYLLHGAWGDYTNWTRNTELQKMAANLQMIIVMPDAGNSFYINSVTQADQKYTDYILKDLSQYVEKKYPVDASKQGIAGLSMGGYGAFYLSTLEPDRFLLSASLSGALAVPGRNYEPIDTTNASPLMKILLEVFGQPDAAVYQRLYAPDFAQKINPANAPYYYFAHGVDDQFKSFLPVHRELVEVLRSRKIAYEYHEVPGEHNWKFWGEQIPAVLQLFEKLCGVK